MKRFNSKLVRLKVMKSPTEIKKDLTFQFQTGAIKRARVLNVSPGDIQGFNSKLVRLKVISAHNFDRLNQSVSIPNWCD